VSADDRQRAAATLAPTGKLVWLAEEEALDAVTALSGSGPAYVFHLIEAMLAAGREMGLAEDDARALALQTVAGAAALAAASSESVETLRKNVTSPGGTTHAAMTRLEAHGFKTALIEAILAARERARELGDESGRPTA
jgi:pyrroline-5-carboxylate reductase